MPTAQIPLTSDVMLRNLDCLADAIFGAAITILLDRSKILERLKTDPRWAFTMSCRPEVRAVYKRILRYGV